MPRFGFDQFVVDTDAVEVLGPDGVRDFEPQVFRVLQYLIEQHGRLVTKEELLDNVWGDRFVSESALTTRIKQARRILDDDGRTQWAIKTVHGRGYRFLPDVTVDADRLNSVEGATTHPRRAAIPDELQPEARRRFWGREDELEQIDAAMRASGDDRSIRWIWLLGEPGIGKTRLAAEVARRTHQLGHHVLFGRNNEDLRVPYQPFIEVIRAALAEVEPAHRFEWLADIPDALVPLLPELAGSTSRGAAAIEDRSTDDETRQYRLFEAIVEWLIQNAAGAPTTMVIDDAHWAADSTLQLLGHLQRRQAAADLTFVITARDTAPDINQRVADLLAAGQGSPNSTVVRLGGLSGEDAVKLLGRPVVDPDELANVMRQTAGNPLLLQAANPSDGSVDVQSAVRRRLGSLDGAVQDTLRLASVIGLDFELRVVAAAARRDELDLLDDLERAVAARLLDDVGVDRFRFTHALIRSSLIDEVGSARRARLHGRIAAAIDEAFGDDPRRLPALAFHTAHAAAADARLVPLAVQRLQRAAEEAMVQLSFDEAVRHLELARGLVDDDDLQLVGRLALRQGIAETRLGANIAALRTFDDAISAARASGDLLLRLESALRFEDAAWRPGLSGVTALGHIDEAIGVLDAAAASGELIADELELRTRLAIGRMRALALSGNTDNTDEAFGAALGLVRELDAPNLEAALLSVYLGQIRFFAGVGDTDHLVDRLAELEPRIDDSDAALHAIHVRLMHVTMTGRFELHDELIASMRRVQERSHSTFWRFIRANQDAMEVFYRGDLVASEQLAEQCLTLADTLPEEDGSGTYGLRMFMIRREQDRLAMMAPVVRHVLSSGEVSGFWTPGLALLLVETGDPDGAADVLSELKERDFDLPRDAMWSTVMVFLIEAAVQLGDLDACAALGRRFADLAGTNVITGSGLLCFGRAERYLGMLAFAATDLGAAEEYLGVALEADAAGNSALWSNESRLWMSRVRRAQGHTAEADAMAAVVVDEARAAGLARLERLAAAELA